MTVQRSFIIGDKWLYYKIYSGVKTADIILTDIIKPLAEQLTETNIIDKWFFIRYRDPKPHIRVRFQLIDTEKIAKIIAPMQTMLKPLIEELLVSKVQTDSYQRELERYGTLTMELSESLFYNDSQMIVNLIEMIEGDEGEEIRWLFCLRAIDALLNDFGYSIHEKHVLMERLKDGFGKEFGMNRQLKGQLDIKFRNKRKEIENILDTKQDEQKDIFPILQLLYKRSHLNNPIAQEILNKKKSNDLEIELNSLLSSYIHMLCNRLFKSKQRVHELVVYDFLYRFYKSSIAILGAKKKTNKNQLLY